MAVRWMAAVLLVAVACVVPAPICAGEADGDGRTIVLDTYGFWRMHQTLRPALIEADGELTPILYDYEWMNCETAPPPAGWAAPDFDDSSWFRAPARMA